MSPTDYKNAYERQKLAREKAESLLEERSRELHETNLSLKDALEKLQGQQDNLIQQEKLAALGMLAAGIAHEINNPIGFISSNLQTLAKYFENIGKLVKGIEVMKSSHDDLIQATPVLGQYVASLEALIKQHDIDYIAEDGSEIINESLDGTNRVSRIVMQLRNYARADNEAMGFQDLNKIIGNMLKLASNNMDKKCELQTDLGKIPPVYGSGTQLGQVVLNICINASQAINDKGVIKISTRHANDEAIITISDNGPGIEKEKLKRIFDPFFSTKDIGEGTGLGLSIVQGIIKKHQGKIEVTSEPGKGTDFTIFLPLYPQDAD